MLARPTSKSGWLCSTVWVNGRSTCARAAGPILDAQPAQLASDVRRICLPVLINASLKAQTIREMPHLTSFIVVRINAARQRGRPCYQGDLKVGAAAGEERPGRAGWWFFAGPWGQAESEFARQNDQNDRTPVGETFRSPCHAIM